jgi:hypothetical protein
MKLNHQPVESPPPLPPRIRKRLDTDCSSLHRSYTSPESDFVKKKWNIFDNVFGKGKKIEPKRREKLDKSAASPREIQLLKTKRNSFSSPDLSHLYCPIDANLNTSGCSNCSFDQSNISSSNSYELENVCEEEDEIVLDNCAQMNGNNISHQIRDNFEPHLNNDMSRVNLVGSGFNLNETSPPPKASPLTPPGYLEMRPGKGFDMRKVEKMDKHLLQNDVLYRLKYSFDSPITYKREFDYDSPPPRPHKSVTEKEPIYLPMNVGTKFSPTVSPKNHIDKSEENVYVPMNRKGTATIAAHPPQTETPSVQTRHANSVVCNGASLSNEENNWNKRNSIDDKIASYYPNYDVPARMKQHSHVRSHTAESVICSKTPDIERKAHTLEREVSASVPIPCSRSKMKRLRSFNTKGANSSDKNNNSNSNGCESPKVDGVQRKYATIARITSPPKHKSSNEDLLDDNNHGSSEFIKKSGSVSPTSIKRFSSLSKFKKIDFSPLRLKISSVLQRHNSGSC